MRSDTFVHAGKIPYSFTAGHEIREDGIEYNYLKIHDDDSEIIIFFENKKDIENLIKELMKIL